MKSSPAKNAVTLIELIIVLAVIVILASIAITVGARIEAQGKERLTEGSFEIINAALTQFRDYGYNYKGADFRDFDFPIDCNDFTVAQVEGKINTAIGNDVVIDNYSDQNFSGSSAMYFLLSRVPASRKTLEQIDESLVTNKDENGNYLQITVGTAPGQNSYAFNRIIDAWGTTIVYDYYDESLSDTGERYNSRRNFPLLISAGPDKRFGTDDDIKSRIK